MNFTTKFPVEINSQGYSASNDYPNAIRQWVIEKIATTLGTFYQDGNFGSALRQLLGKPLAPELVVGRVRQIITEAVVDIAEITLVELVVNFVAEKGVVQWVLSYTLLENRQQYSVDDTLTI